MLQEGQTLQGLPEAEEKKVIIRDEYGADLMGIKR